MKLERAGADGQPEPEAVGFRLRVDGFRFVLNAAHLATPPPLSAEMLARFRVEYFTHRLATAPALRGVVNVFQAGWLAQISLAMLTATALHNGWTWRVPKVLCTENVRRRQHACSK